MSDFELHVGGSKYTGWTSVELSSSIESLAHTFTADLVDTWVDQQEPIPVEAGDQFSLSYKGETLTTGYMDQDTLRYNSNRRTLSLAARSKTGDLVDCAAIHKSGQWNNTGLLQIARDLCRPFGISVSTNVRLGAVFAPPDRFAIEEGETVFEALSRGARKRGVLMLTDSGGNVVFDRAGTERVTTVIQRGVNVVEGTKTNSWGDRFSKYIVKAQTPGNDSLFGKPAAAIKRTASDSGVDRYRPTVIMADTESSGTELQKRVTWERNVRAGRAKRLTYTLVGWEHSKGVWKPNRLVRVVDEDSRIDDELLIVSVTLSRSNQGTFTTMELTIPEAFDVQPLPPKKKTKTSLFP